jgi:ABC-2 type transport system ATP-binding protein
MTRFFRPTFETVTALEHVSLRIGRGEVVAYAGPNGAGKSTTIKILSGLLVPDSGHVRVLGLNATRQRLDLVSRISVVFGQRTELWWDHPVAASFDWKRVVWGIERADYERMVGFVKELLGLDEFFHSMTRELSLGQRMRADLGLALINEPELMLLDEPTLGLDVLAKRRVLQSIVDLNRERGMTVLVTSHDMPDLEALASRVVMINHGTIAFDGPFSQFRCQLGDPRRLIISTDSVRGPILSGATLVRSEAGRHEYAFDANDVPIARLIDQAGAETELLDVETQRTSIDDVVADVYDRWLSERAEADRRA